MSDNELKEWFWNKFNSCYYVTRNDYPESLLMYYDTNFIRKAKFAVLQGKEIVYPVKPSGDFLFEQDYKNGWFNCSYKHIWSFLKSNTNYNHQEIRDLIKGWLEEDTKIKVLTPSFDYTTPANSLEEDTKIKVLTPFCNFVNLFKKLEEDTKIKVLKPIYSYSHSFGSVEDNTKLKVLIPTQI